jgi:hypothetical protein
MLLRRLSHFVLLLGVIAVIAGCGSGEAKVVPTDASTENLSDEESSFQGATPEDLKAMEADKGNQDAPP